MADRDPETFAEVKTRLDEIVEAVSDDNLSLDDALSLYEEAVALGLRASDLLEKDIEPEEVSAEASDRLQKPKDADDAEVASVEATDSGKDSKISAESFDGLQSPKESNSVEAVPAGNPSATQNINVAAGAAAGSVA